jgi:hypothetical protein
MFESWQCDSAGLAESFASRRGVLAASGAWMIFYQIIRAKNRGWYAVDLYPKLYPTDPEFQQTGATLAH